MSTKSAHPAVGNSAANTEYEDHPLAARYPLLEGADYEALKADIQANGLKYGIWLYERKILDGRNRYRACRELGIELATREYEGDDPAGFIDSLNLHRRHLTAEFRRQRVSELRAKGMGTREIAEKVGVSQMTVVRDLAAGESGVSPDPEPAADEPAAEQPPPQPAKVTGRDGKKYPAKRKATAVKKLILSDHTRPDAEREPEEAVQAKPPGDDLSWWRLLGTYKSEAQIMYEDFRKLSNKRPADRSTEKFEAWVRRSERFLDQMKKLPRPRAA
jgi:hypothetical protein